MPVLAIYKLDSDEDPVSTLEAGEHIFGRGSLLKCDDRRVSRKHGVITVTDDAARITSTHQNPCFYQSVHSSTITILPKDSPVDISDGDKFALLADQFWFRIKVEKAANGVQMVQDAVGVGDDVSTRVYENSLSEIDKIERHSPSPQISKLCSSSTSNRTENVQDDSDNSMDFLNVTPKRELEEDDMEMASSKKAKVDDELVKNKDGPLAVWNDKSKKEIMSESEDENNIDVKPTSSLPKQQATPKKGRAASKKKVEALITVQNDHDAELKSMLFSSDDEEVNKAPQNVSSVNSTEETKVINEVKEDKNDKKDANDKQKTNEDTNAPGTSGTKRQWRDRCWYGMSCYRKSSQHSREFRHPGDSDYESDPNDDRPTCAYGDTCYRQNKNHRQAYKHTKPPQKAPNKRKKKNNDGTATKKRATKKQYYDESSEDEYDMEDPFMADSGSEFEADSGSSDDDDSDSNSSGTEEETKRLLKEAKRFTKGKKKDKDND